MRSRRWTPCVLALAIALSPLLADAHGGPPLPRQVFAVPDDDGAASWVMTTNFGVITQEAPDRFVCEEAFWGSEQFLLLPLGPTQWVTFTSTAIFYTTDGCTFERIQDLRTRPAQVALEPTTGRMVFAINHPAMAEVHVAQTPTDFTPLPIDLSDLRLTGAGFLGPDHLLLTAHDTTPETRGQAHLFLVHLPTQTLDELPLDSSLLYPFLLTTSPTSFVWHARKDDATHVFHGTLDAPQARFLASTHWPSAAAIDPSTNTVYIAGIDDEGLGVFAWNDDLRQVLPGHDAPCLIATPGGLLACGRRDRDGFDLAVVNGDDTVTPLLDFRDLQGPRVDCAPGSQTAVTCPAVWPELARYLGIEVEDVDEDEDEELSDTPPSPDESRGDEPRGCGVAGGEPAPVGFVVVVVLLFIRRR